MRRKDESEMELRKAKMVLRRFINLKHALVIQEELNDLEPELEERYWKAVNEGIPFTFNVKELADRVDARQ